MKFTAPKFAPSGLEFRAKCYFFLQRDYLFFIHHNRILKWLSLYIHFLSRVNIYKEQISILSIV
jgi:hypothetical protein